jgi:purine-cytosine permease-like protein
MKGVKLMFWVNLLFFLSLIGRIRGLDYLMIISWIIALILLYRNTGYKVIKVFYVILGIFLLLLMIYLISEG